MDIRKILFLGGDVQKLASVQIRCVDIAKHLGCDYQLRTKYADAVSGKYSVFVCVKPDLWPGELQKLSTRGVVIWDVVDYVPPRTGVGIYLVSSRAAQKLLKNFGRVELIHHHHCNFTGKPNSGKSRRPSWIGSREWFPVMHDFEFDYYDVAGMTGAGVAQACRKTGIGLNLRIPRNQYLPVALRSGARANRLLKPKKLAEAARRCFDLHLAVNSGIKLINCIGFGIPSISSDEPAYHEIGAGCTIFSNLKKCSDWVRALQNDDELYHDLRQKCMRVAPRFHLENIAREYKALFASL